MRTRAFALSLLLLAQTFCPLLQQSSALAQDLGPAASAATEDSDGFLQSATHARRPARDYASRVEALVRQMTLEEKVGQMTQLEIGMVSTGGDQTIQIDPAKLERAVVKYGVGSILNVNGQALTADRWQEIIRQIQEAAQRTRLRIPVLYGIDSNRTRLDFGATIPWSDTIFYRVGMRDFGQENQFNVQRGQRIAGNFWARYGVHASTDEARSLIRHPAEQALIRELLRLPDVVSDAADRRETHEIPKYCLEVAGLFSQFYRDCRVLTDDPEDARFSAARVALVDATRFVLANGLGTLGIRAPESM